MLHPEMLAGTWEADVPAAREWAGTKCSNKKTTKKTTKKQVATLARY
jgi:hypothetical protein